MKTSLHRRITATALLVFLPYVATVAQAATTTDTFLVQANVSATCSVSATDLIFVDYAGSALPATSTISVTCTSGTTYYVRLNQGLHGASVTARQMQRTTGGTETLNYGLYRDSGHTQNWGETDGVDTPAQGTGTGSAQDSTVYGLIPGNQNPPVANYEDMITVTLSY